MLEGSGLTMIADAARRGFGGSNELKIEKSIQVFLKHQDNGGEKCA